MKKITVNIALLIIGKTQYKAAKTLKILIGVNKIFKIRVKILHELMIIGDLDLLLINKHH